MGEMKLAKWWEAQENGKILCTLCPRYCEIGEGQRGFCFIRKNIGDKLYSLGYGKPIGFGIDPIEKKPLYHFYPGSKILSFGTAGCNLGCKFCQNWEMSKAKTDSLNSIEANPEAVVELTKEYGIPSIAFTYNDPTIFGEYVIDIARLAKEENLNTVMVTAGYIDKIARKEIYENITAANVDLKAFSEEFYHKLTYSHLNDVLDTLLWLKRETDVWLEITTLLIPDENDSPDELKRLSAWVVENLGADVPIHFTAFHPDFKMRDKERTPAETLTMARKIAISEGVNYCYIGNVHDREGQSTRCKSCGTKVISRDWHQVLRMDILKGKCPQCGSVIDGCFG